MTERRRSSLHRDAVTLSIGPSRLAWEGDGLTIDFNEVTAPTPTRLRGTIRLHPGALATRTYALDGRGRHAWRPIAPRAAVEVELSEPAVRWRGKGYFDTNGGDQPLERSFSTWTWSRAHRAKDTVIYYDVDPERAGTGVHLALRIDAEGAVEEVAAPPFHAVRPTFWLMPRHVRGDADAPPRLRHTLEDAPFYSRSTLDGVIDGEAAEIVHESLSAGRLRSPIVKRMLPYRMPRRVGRG